MKKDFDYSVKINEKLKKMAMSAEDQVSRCRNSLKICDIERAYESMGVKMPNKMKVAMFLIFQFEHTDFSFEIVYREAIM